MDTCQQSAVATESTDGERNTETFPVIGVGASAGGLEAFGELIEGLPRDLRCAVVFVQHLPPNHESMLQGLLSDRRPDLAIEQAEDDRVLEPGHVYIAPPSTEVTIRGGVLHIGDVVEEHPSHVIDTFLASLADECHQRAVGVILSGAGHDGTRGVAEIRSQGGCVIVQDPATARFPSMPQSAIDTGVADLVLAPAAIARSAAGIGDVCEAVSEVDDLTNPGHLRTFFEVLYKTTGYRFEHYKQSVVERRVRRRMRLHNVASVRDYMDTIRHDPGEARQLATDFMIGVTSFFRDPDAWEELRKRVVRRLVRQRSDEPIRVWTPACSTGEESYSIAMMLADELEKAQARRDLLVFASDINDTALDKARRGVYAAGAAEDIPRRYRDKYTTPAGADSAILIDGDIRSRIVFAKHSMLGDPPFSRQDLIICRNLLIYLDPTIQDRCIDTFHYALHEDQYLFLGKAETVSGKQNLFRSLEPKQARIYQRLPGPSPTRFPSAIRPSSPSVVHRGPARQPEPQSSVIDAARNVLLGTYAPAAVAIDKHYTILFNSGPVNRYLVPPPGEPTSGLLEQLPSRLATRIRGAVRRAVENDEAVVLHTTLPKERGGAELTITVSRIEERTDHFIVVFEQKQGRRRSDQRRVSVRHATGESEVRRLEDELTATRLDLQQHIEQLRSMNEELQSSNEELTVSNEELETSREELQSLNEELVTVNGQLQAKMAELERANNDLVNFQASTDIPVLFLDRRLRVRRFTPAMTRLIGLLAGDRGRPITDLAHERLGPDLMDDLKHVLDELTPVEREIAVDDAWYSRVIRPYRTADERVEGAVIAFSDITKLKRAEEQIRAAAEKFRIVADFTYDWEYWRGTDNRFVYMTPSCERATGYTRDKFLGDAGLYTAIIHPEDRERIATHLSENQTLQKSERLEFRIVRRDGQVRWMDHVCQPVVGEHGQVIGRRATNRDITERKRLENQLRQRANELATANRELESFSYSVSHDLRNPLNNVGLLIGVLTKRTAGSLDQEGRRSLDYIESNLARMSNIISDLLQLSRISRHELEIGRTDLGVLAQDFVKELRRTNPERGIEVTIHEGMIAHADNRLIKLALENLIRNAWKYTSKCEHPRIEIGVEERRGQRVFFVQDNGVGFDMQDAERIFDAFQRAHSDKEYKGSGVGLSIVKRIVQRHGGEVWAESAKGDGARFSFTLPCDKGR